MSKSTTQVEWPRWARPVAKEAAEVVLPTPPLPEVMHMIRPRDGVVVVEEEVSLSSTSDGCERINGWVVGEEEKCRRDFFCCSDGKCCCVADDTDCVGIIIDAHR